MPTDRVAASKPEKSLRYPTLQRFLRYFYVYKQDIFATSLLVVITAACQALGPFLVGWSIDNLITRGNLRGLIQILVLLAVVYIFSSFVTRAQIRQIGWIMQRLLAQLRSDIFTKIQSLPLSFFERSQAGDLMSRLLNDVSTVEQTFGIAIAQIVGSVFGLIGIIIAMLSLNLQLGLMSNLVVPLMIFATGLFAKWSRTKFRLTRQTIGQLSARLEEDINSVREAQAFNRVKFNLQQFDTVNAANRDANVDAMATTAAFLPSIDLLNTLGTAGVMVYGGYLAVKGTATVGTVTSFLLYVQLFFQPIQVLSQFYNQSQSALAGLERIFLLLDEPVYLKDTQNAIEMPTIKGEVRFENVRFGYKQEGLENSSGKLALNGVTFHVKQGQMIALVGATGAGKSTIINLILRFYDVISGAITIDNIDIRRVTQESLRRQIGIVLQDTVLLSGTIAENIAFGRPGTSQAEIEQAAQTANVHEFISSLPQGYATPLGEKGTSLSYGQQQLISIARAVLINPRILILDEATSSIDTRTEALVQEALARLLKGRTSFVIAHRLSTVTSADQVFVVEQGQIVERGTHEELIAKGGVYANLYGLQLGTDVV
jgi:ATP-binding cassette, subfamily B, multidrug efflux pump